MSREMIQLDVTDRISAVRENGEPFDGVVTTLIFTGAAVKKYQNLTRNREYAQRLSKVARIRPLPPQVHDTPDPVEQLYAMAEIIDWTVKPCPNTSASLDPEDPEWLAAEGRPFRR